MRSEITKQYSKNRSESKQWTYASTMQPLWFDSFPDLSLTQNRMRKRKVLFTFPCLPHQSSFPHCFLILDSPESPWSDKDSWKLLFLPSNRNGKELSKNQSPVNNRSTVFFLGLFKNQGHLTATNSWPKVKSCDAKRMFELGVGRGVRRKGW